LVLNFACTRDRAELGTAENPVKFMLVPSVDAKLLADKAVLVQKYLEANTPYKYKFAIPTSYVAVVEAFGTKRADVASLNTFGYIMAHERYKANALITVKRFGEDKYKAQIIARADSSINKLEDITGKKFAYVDPASTSGYLLPAKMFKDRNVNPSETVFAQKHINVVMMVYQGQVDAGATFYSPPQNGKIEDARRLVKTQYEDVEQKVKIVELTDEIPNDPIVFRADMPEEMKSKIVDSLVAYVGTEEGKAVFHELYGVTDFVKSTDATYDGVREMLQKLGKTAQDLAKK
jgi:phosphonate transport system substrate-binding protein